MLSSAYLYGENCTNRRIWIRKRVVDKIFDGSPGTKTTNLGFSTSVPIYLSYIPLNLNGV
jgi:hypothetical protein